MKRFLLTVAAIGLSIGSAHATLMTRTYTNYSTFTSGPLTDLTLTFSVTYDPASTSRTATLNSLTSSSPLASFAGPNGAEIFFSGGNGFLTVGGLASFGVLATNGNTNDFYTFFQFDRNGDVVGTDANAVSYGQRGVFTLTQSATSVTTAVAAVPEPATWAMLIGGFALTGAALRRRRMTARFA